MHKDDKRRKKTFIPADDMTVYIYLIICTKTFLELISEFSTAISCVCLVSHIDLFKNQHCFTNFSIVFLFLISFVFVLTLSISILAWGLFCSFSSFLEWEIGLLTETSPLFCCNHLML